MRIIPAQPARIPDIVELISSCTKNMLAHGIDQWDGIYPSAQDVSEDVHSRSMYVFLDNYLVIAAICLNEVQDPTYRTASWVGQEPVLVVHRLCIEPSHQGKGIGKQLMDFAEDYAMRRRYRSIRLDAYTGNPAAIKLYERRGYRKAGETFLPRRTLPFVLFEKAFSEYDVA